MNNASHIVDIPLPPEQDFKFLREKGLDYIREYSGSSWSNLNSSDPGITILDQVCYAMSELGYCGDFPVGDLLAGPDEKLKINNQFYLPEQILTTSPITAEDYIKYIVDEADEVENAIIISSTAVGLKIYKVYLLIRNWETNKDRANDICKAAFYALNRCRNLGELFLTPLALEQVTVNVQGTLVLENNNNSGTFFNQLQQLLNNYIFPPAKATGFDKLYPAQRTEDIINGPALKNGWITSDALGIKKNRLTCMELAHFFENINGIADIVIDGLKMDNNSDAVTEAQVPVSQLIHIDLVGSIQKGLLLVSRKSTTIPPAKMISLLHSSSPGSETLEYEIHPEVMNGKLRKLPAVKYRNVADYYSIQNTFPEIYAAGTDAITSNAADYQMAQSRQLKGYLTLFDQVLANQFAQLAAIDKLFSFKNTSSGAEQDEKIFYAKQNKLEESRGMYPVPYKTFSPTYFYQSLYDVPHIKSLLKDHDIFAFEALPASPEEQELQTWEAYKLDPYNSYMRGLMDCMDDEAVNITRRNDILDHLLARYGESPLFIDTIIGGPGYSGNNLKDRVIIKSLLLQHLGLLSYYRAKGANYPDADTVERRLPRIHYHPEPHATGSFTNDFLVDLYKVDEEEKIPEHDLVNFSTVELKLNLLLGLKTIYRNFIAESLVNAANKPEIKAALWLIRERRGLLLIETTLLNYFLKNGAGTGTGMDKLNTGQTWNGVALLFPSFVIQLNTEDFKKRIKLFLKNTLPVSVPYRCYFIDKDSLLRIIPAYANWVNSIRHFDENINRSFTSSVKLNNELSKITPVDL